MNLKGSILIIDDEINIAEGLSKILLLEKHKVDIASNGKIGLSMALKKDYDIILSDLKMPEMDGETFLKELSSIKPYIKVIILTGHGTIQNAVSTMRDGAYDFFIKPIDIERLLMSIQHALKIQRLEEENHLLKKKLGDDSHFALSDLIGNSTSMQNIIDIIKQVAKSKTSILIEGESGTGKELVAKAIYQLSDRNQQILVSVNCAAINENLFESELFGHEKGAFTGAISQKKGRFELANNGTLFLDEVGDMPINTQVKLLRVLQEKVFERVGSEESLHSDVRIISATNRDLYKEVQKGNFREDLYYRLNVVNIKMPSLRERREDVPLLINAFIKEFSVFNNKVIEGITPEALKILQQYKWPGNIRELRNTIEGMVVLSKEPILTKDYLTTFLKKRSQYNTIHLELGRPLSEVEKKYILKTLEFTKDNKSKAADLLEIGRKTLYRKLEEYGK